jgi:cyclic pyranopterin phosphate synthase
VGRSHSNIDDGRDITMTVVDRLHRPLGAVRISVTDRCNMRCRYCMPEDDYAWLPRDSILTFEEIDRLAGAFAILGVHKIRLTGGEPLLRRDLDKLVSLLRRRDGVREIALTTNGLLLGRQAADLKMAGLDRVTVSLDTLHPERMQTFARNAHHADVLAGIDAALALGWPQVKTNTVVVRGYNDDELADIAEFGFERGIEPRFIEYMDVGGATQWRSADVVSALEILDLLSRRFGAAHPLMEAHDPHAPAQRYQFANGCTVGVIASTTAPFCRDCDRMRVTADGTMFLCLYAEHGVDLRDPLRRGADDADLQRIIADAWRDRSDRGAETRHALAGRSALVPLQRLRADPRQEMHVRGG